MTRQSLLFPGLGIAPVHAHYGQLWRGYRGRRGFADRMHRAEARAWPCKVHLRFGAVCYRAPPTADSDRPRPVPRTRLLSLPRADVRTQSVVGQFVSLGRVQYRSPFPTRRSDVMNTFQRLVRYAAWGAMVAILPP